MHDIWNPWHGCIKKSEGCAHCYMYTLDKRRGMDGSRIFKVRNNFEYPLATDKSGKFKIKSGEHIRVCLTSDFFLAQADAWRSDAWNVIKRRPDVAFYLLTKRPERVADCLPADWGGGWENVFFSVTCENQMRADERIPLLLSLPFKHKGVIAAPFIGAVSVADYLKAGQIEQVLAGGENYDGARPLRYEWVKALSDECRAADVTFCFFETGTVFVKDGKTYTIPDKVRQSGAAFRSGLSFEGKPVVFKLTEPQPDLFKTAERHVPFFGEQCEQCGSRMLCNGCSKCGRCAAIRKIRAES